MTKKRFTFADGFKIVAIRDNGKIMNSKQVCDKLNQLHEEVRQLNGIVDFYKSFQKDARELEKENEQLKQQLKEYKQPNCKKCIEYSQDGVGDYCMSEKGLLGKAWKMFPCEWNYCNAKNCKEYEE